jgi:phage gpG-like protein
LYETGNLFRSIQQAAVEGNETRITTDVPYAKYHQFGLGNNLKREFMGVSDLDARLVERILNKYLDDAINKTFGSR